MDIDASSVVGGWAVALQLDEVGEDVEKSRAELVEFVSGEHEPSIAVGRGREPSVVPVNIATSGLFSVLVLFVVGPRAQMQWPESAYGLLLACVALGAVVGSTVAEGVQRRLGRVRVLVVAVIGLALSFAVPAITAQTAAVATALFTAGFLSMLANVIMVSLRQMIVPDRLLGGTNASMRLLGMGLAPIGAVVAGVVADVLGLRAVFFGAAALTLLCLPGFLIVTEERIEAAERLQEAERARSAT